MAISPQGGNSVSSAAVAVAAQALPSYSSTTGRKVFFSVTLGATTSFVSSIGNSAGTYANWTLLSSSNGTGVRVELWQADVVTGAATVFTVNIGGGNTTCTVCLEEYSGGTAIGNTHSNAAGNSNQAYDSCPAQDSNNYVVTAFGTACQSGDTYTGQIGNQRQNNVPAATAVSSALYDNTMTPSGTIANQTKINTTRQWAACSAEIRSGATLTSIDEYNTPSVGDLSTNFRELKITEPVFGTLTPSAAAPAPVAQVLQQGAIGFAYTETISVAGGVAPFTFSIIAGALPTGTTINASTGVISGTPSVAGTYTFTVQVVDVNSSVGTQVFSITIVSPIIAGGTWGYVA